MNTVIFDLDGTLVQTEKLKARSYALAAEELRPGALDPELLRANRWPASIEVLETVDERGCATALALATPYTRGRLQAMEALPEQRIVEDPHDLPRRIADALDRKGNARNGTAGRGREA